MKVYVKNPTDNNGIRIVKEYDAIRNVVVPVFAAVSEVRGKTEETIWNKSDCEEYKYGIEPEQFLENGINALRLKSAMNSEDWFLSIIDLVKFLRYCAKIKSLESGSKFPVSDMEIDIESLMKSKQSVIHITLRDKGCESDINGTYLHYNQRVDGLTIKGEELWRITITAQGTGYWVKVNKVRK